jgi:hypothetical protein
MPMMQIGDEAGRPRRRAATATAAPRTMSETLRAVFATASPANLCELRDQDRVDDDHRDRQHDERRVGRERVRASD